MTSGPKPKDGSQQDHYVYDGWDRLVAVYNDNGGVPGTLSQTYEYDGLGRRTNGLSAGSGQTQDYYYDTKWRMLQQQLGGSGAKPEEYIWSERYADSPVVRFRDTNGDGSMDETFYYTTDANNNVTAMVQTTGSVQERYSYDPYGSPHYYNGSWTSLSDTQKSNRLLYGGAYHLGGSNGLYYIRNRYYNPTLGRFLTRDPSGYGADGMNLYQYVRSDPTNSIDPSGGAAYGMVSGGTGGGASTGAGEGLPPGYVGAATTGPDGSVNISGGGGVVAPVPTGGYVPAGGMITHVYDPKHPGNLNIHYVGEWAVAGDVIPDSNGDYSPDYGQATGTISGFYVWLYTGNWTSSEEAYRAAVAAAGAWLFCNSPIRGGLMTLAAQTPGRAGVFANGWYGWTMDDGQIGGVEGGLFAQSKHYQGLGGGGYQIGGHGSPWYPLLGGSQRPDKFQIGSVYLQFGKEGYLEVGIGVPLPKNLDVSAGLLLDYRKLMQPWWNGSCSCP